ncbi:MAG: hypothetical protein CSA89_00890 [Bacteroidales bacterium]|nr:MAG: hypothetical protein CSA89_00890 [Bacteroidales bacterium]
MKKTYIIFLIILSFCNIAISQINNGSRYAKHSILNTGKWVKVAVPQSGIYQLSYEDIKGLGIVPNDVRIYGYGGALIDEDFSSTYIDDLPEVPIFMQKGADGVFNDGDYILFYAQANVSWRYDETDGNFYHIRNHYANAGHYFITAKQGKGKRINVQESMSMVDAVDITEFNDYILHEEELVSLIDCGREFWGESFNLHKSRYDFSFSIPNILSQKANITIDLATKATIATNMSLFVDGLLLENIEVKPKSQQNYLMAETTHKRIDFMPQKHDKLSFALQYSSPTDMAYLNYLEINYKRKLEMYGSELYFRTKDYLHQNIIGKFIISNANKNVRIWDITNPLNIVEPQSSLEGSNLVFFAETGNLRQFVAVDILAAFPKPTIVGEVVNQDIHAMPQADMLILASEDFLPQAIRLANYHRERRGLKVNVVGEKAVFNEFSSGTPDASAYRRFAKMFYDRASDIGTKPKWLLLFGDGIFDNRTITNGSAELRKLLTYQAENSTHFIRAYTSDDYFAYLDDNDKPMTSSAEMDIAVGRFPVYMQSQANTIVDKTISYMDNIIRGEWKNRVLFVADDGDDNAHAEDCDSVATIMHDKNRSCLVRKLYLDAYQQETTASSESYPDANSVLDNYIKKGVLMVNYMGHGSYTGWANEKLLTTAKIVNMTNDKYPLFVTATCDFSAFDQFISSGGEQLMWNKLGGTMALITTTRVVYSNANADLNYYLATHFFTKNNEGNPLSIGEILLKSKNAQKGSDNKFAFTLLGDPSLSLQYPYQAKVITDSINGKPIGTDTIAALSEVEVAGHIETRYGDKIHGFDGQLSVEVFDKVQTIHTLANDQGSTPFVYEDRVNPIFRGYTDIKNGYWRFKFFVPKDINYNYGTGRIVYYATENNLGLEANGYYENLLVGGENPNPMVDVEGPEVSLFMNSRAFTNGDVVNSSPLFIADVFDRSGINTSGNGIGHNIVLKKNIKDKDYVILNDYYIANYGGYKSGRVEYQLDNLPEGKYNMWFKVWDLQNNSTEKEICFVVDNDDAISADIEVFPNPATDFVTFRIHHNRPYKALGITLRLYDMLGQMLYASPIEKVANGTNATEITWNFVAEGLNLSKGIYVVYIELFAKGEKSSYKPVKLIVK